MEQCTLSEHVNVVDRLYNNIVPALQQAGDKFHKLSNSSFNQLPQWNEYCRDLHSNARDSNARDSFLISRGFTAVAHFGSLYDKH